MSNKIIYNIIILAVVWLVIMGTGFYVTMVKQPATLEQVEKAEKVIRLKEAELASLITEHEASYERADAAMRKWRARYKIIPDQLTGPEVIGYLNQLTKTGFEVFDVSNSGTTGEADYSFHSFSVSGRGNFTDLYRVIWELENNRYFYRIPDLTLIHINLIKDNPKTGGQEMKVMVSFQMQIDAIFSGAEGMSAPTAGAIDGEAPEGGLQASTDIPPVPKGILPNERPAINPFKPIILAQVPPNTYGHIDIEASTLISIVDGKAVFQEGDRYRSVGVGEDVYLGQIIDIDPLEGRVKARLNRGGIIDDVELFLQVNDVFRQAQGSAQLKPVE